MTASPDPGKQAAAQEAATRFATDMAQAIACYAELTKQTGLLQHLGQEILEEEMCALLPAYRHPVHDASTEYILFFDPAGLPAASHQPGLPAALADDTTWLAEELRLCLQMLAQVNQPEVNPAAGTTLRAFRRQRAYQTYVRLVRHKGMARQEALQIIAALYACANTHEALQMLKDEQEEVVRRWQKGAPCLAETVLSRWRGLLPEG